MRQEHVKTMGNAAELSSFVSRRPYSGAPIPLHSSFSLDQIAFDVRFFLSLCAIHN